jgi:hypothetical protein
MEVFFMDRLNKFYYCLLVLSVLFASLGFSRWLRAKAYTPPIPLQVVANRYSFEKPKPAFPLSRYTGLQTGELFFGPTPEPESAAGPVRPVFSSQLLLYGVSQGAKAGDSRALVGMTGEPANQTFLVKIGSVVNAETVLKIEKQSIWVRNATGEGRVGLRDWDSSL